MPPGFEYELRLIPPLEPITFTISAETPIDIFPKKNADDAADKDEDTEKDRNCCRLRDLLVRELQIIEAVEDLIFTRNGSDFGPFQIGTSKWKITVRLQL